MQFRPGWGFVNVVVRSASGSHDKILQRLESRRRSEFGKWSWEKNRKAQLETSSSMWLEIFQAVKVL